MPDPSLVAYAGPMALLPESLRRDLLDRGRRALLEARVQVMPLGHDVRDRGDDALIRLAQRFDKAALTRLDVEDWAWAKQVATVPKRDRDALAAMVRRVKAYHERQLPEGFEVTVDGVRMGWRPVPLDRVGVYVPGGHASYPSTLVMAAVPARLAGVEEVVVCTPPRPDGTVSPLLLAAADLAGVEELYLAGGAQAVFAMAYGTRTIRPVQKIVGPGNVYVQAAKQLVNGFVGIDALAGPSEVVVLADGSAPPALVAWELAAQAEHGPDGTSVLVTTSQAVLEAVQRELARLAPGLPRQDTILKSLRRQGALLLAEGMTEALAFVNAFAPEHLVVMTKDPRALLPRIKAAGSVFLGPHSPVALGDYGAGTNHILPTSRGAAYGSGLSCLDFVRFVQWQEATPAALEKVGPHVEHLAAVEGLSAHGGAVAARRAKGRKG